MKKILFVIPIILILSYNLSLSEEGDKYLSEAEKKIHNEIDKIFKRRFDKIKSDLQEIIIQEINLWEDEYSKTLNLKILFPAELGEAIKTITEEELKEHVEYLASDELEGRETGKHGCDKAADYIAKIFKELGLKPGGDEDTYFQNFTIGKKKIKTKNVIGYIEGSDPNLKDECVVVGAHYDHVGMGKDIGSGRLGSFLKKKDPKDPDDIIYNGADDNASGTSTILEIAEAFIEGNLKPKRTVIFILFAGEEIGFLGSYYYVKNPLFPLNKTVAMINLDMVGRNKNKKLMLIDSKSSPELHEISRQVVNKLNENVNFIQSGGFGGSDHAVFYSKGIPVIFFFSGGHKDYHMPSDESDKIEPEKMKTAGNIACAITLETANYQGKLNFKKLTLQILGDLFRFDRTPRLGIYPRDLDDEDCESLDIEEDRGAVYVEEVIPNSVADECGLKADDVIIEFNGQKLQRDDPSASLRTLIAKVKRKTPVKIVIIRNGKKMTLEATFK